MKRKLIGLFSCLCVIMVFIPLPPLAIEILYYVDLGYGFILLEICLFIIFKKNQAIPKFLGPLFICFALFTYALDAMTTRFAITLKDVNELIPILSENAQSFLKFPYAGYVILVCFLALPIYMLVRKLKIEDEDLVLSYRFMQGMIKAMLMLFLVAILGGTLVGITKEGLGFVESLLLHLPFACAQVTSYIFAVHLAGMGFTLLVYVKENKIDWFLKI